MDFGNLLFSAYGRIGRQEFWVAWLVLMAAGIVTWAIPVINLVAWIVLLYCGICIRAKRLHDMGHSGWMQLIPVVAKVIFGIVVAYLVILGLIAGFTFGPVAAPGIALGVVTLVIAAMATCLIQLGFLLWIGIAPGDPLDNPYGPSAGDVGYRMGAPA